MSNRDFILQELAERNRAVAVLQPAASPSDRADSSQQAAAPAATPASAGLASEGHLSPSGQPPMSPHEAAPPLQTPEPAAAKPQQPRQQQQAPTPPAATSEAEQVLHRRCQFCCREAPSPATAALHCFSGMHQCQLWHAIWQSLRTAGHCSEGSSFTCRMLQRCASRRRCEGTYLGE